MEEPEAPSSVAGSYQESDGSSVTVANVVAGNDGWIVIRTDNSFEPGDVLGYVQCPQGEYEDLIVELDEAADRERNGLGRFARGRRRDRRLRVS